MRRFRSFAAALLGALLLQVTFLGSASACARVADAAPSSRAAAAGHEAHDAHAEHEQDARHAPAPDEHAPAHCIAAMSCTMVGVASAGAALLAAHVAPVVRIAAHDDDAPASTRGAPEPPPPRA